MTALFRNWYKALVIEQPIVSLLLVAVLIIIAGIQATNFRLDATAESLLLESDKDLSYYREINKRYSAMEFLFITYKPKGDILSDVALNEIRTLRDELLELERVHSVLSILDVPLIDSPRVSFTELSDSIRTLETPGVDKELARKEFLSSPLYRNLVMSENGDTIALQVNLKTDETYYALIRQRNQLREKSVSGTITPEEEILLDELIKKVKVRSAMVFSQESEDISKIRTIMSKHRGTAEMFLGGATMVTSDMVEFIKRDLFIFGIAIFIFLVGTLTIIFRQLRWVLLPMLCCSLSAYVVLGILGWVDWPVTVISSNFISLLLIITMSLTVHLIVRYRELQSKNSNMPQNELVFETVRQMSSPCFYTAITTIAAFGSLVVSDIRPIIDFGYIMIVGICTAFILSFILFPSATILLKRPAKIIGSHDFTAVITASIAKFTEHHSRKIIMFAIVATLISGYGISLLEVENRFIDYFKDDTEIHQGMLVIDRDLGGTMPLDFIIKADDKFYKFLEDQKNVDFNEESILFDEEGEDDFLMEELEAEISSKASEVSYWFNSSALERLDQVHDYIDGLSETGKVISLATSMKLVRQINNDVPLDDLELAILRKKLPDEIRASLIDPYVSEDGNEVRITTRIIESDPNLRRAELIKKILHKLTNDFGFSVEQVRASNRLVLYNNMLQSLFRSQILTLGVVMFCILCMFVVLFRSVYLAVVAIVPNLISASIILGVMGIFGIPLDLMSITIAAITIGIAVDNAIHYIYRYKKEFAIDHDYEASVRRCHGSIGRAIYYTSLTIIAGFSILVLSNFIPTIYFGLLTAIAMLIAFCANLVLLPRLLVLFKPLGKV